MYSLEVMDGSQPRNCPKATIDLFNGKLYIHADRGHKAAKLIESNPHVELWSMNDNGEWLRAKCDAVRDENIDEQKRMLNRYPHLKEQYQPGDGKTAVYELKNGKATISSFKHPTVELEF